MTKIKYEDRMEVEDIILNNVPSEMDNNLHIVPSIEMNKLIFELIENKVLPLDKKTISYVCKEWKLLLTKKFALLN